MIFRKSKAYFTLDANNSRAAITTKFTLGNEKSGNEGTMAKTSYTWKLREDLDQPQPVKFESCVKIT